MDVLVRDYDLNFIHGGSACLCGWPVALLADDWMLGTGLSNGDDSGLPEVFVGLDGITLRSGF